MKQLEVWITFPNNETLLCGEIVTETPDFKGLTKGAFWYVQDYLDHPMAFPIDPVALPLKNDEFQTQRPSGIHAVFEDALPDDWGIRLLIRKAGLGRREQTKIHLLEALGADGLGALSFKARDKTIQDSKPYADMIDLHTLLELALNYDTGRYIEEKNLYLLFRAGSSPGGARPKAIIRDDLSNLWIAKFPSSRDRLAMVPIEAATLELAKHSGLNIPEFNIREVGKRKILMVKRFDISEKKGRYHMISARTLLEAEGDYLSSYDALFEKLKEFTVHPSIDLPLFFRQMVFNCAIGNTDDHLKNFTILHKENGFCLSPAYDLLPDTEMRREHDLMIGSSFLPPSRADLEKLANKWKIRQADKIIDEIIEVVSKWKTMFKKYKVPDADIAFFEWDLNRRQKRMRS
ncbi:MAG: type II toxin-antitoxin system HipA family toxin [Desulfobacula sp.]|nr:type II toxin-antitoxin system HipA family toxin [Desulfobacula sp.]